MFVSQPKPILLVIENNPVISQLLETAVKSKRGDSVEIITATTTEEGLKAAKERRPDLIFLDWMLPPLRGEEFLEKQSLIPGIADLPVLVYSAGEGRGLSDLPEYYAAVKGIIPNPLSPSKVYEAMKPYLKSRLLSRENRPLPRG